MSGSLWTSREVHFEVYPRQNDKIEPLMDALVDHYWGRGYVCRRLIEPGVASQGSLVVVSGLPWWMPGWWARRTVAIIAQRAAVTGSATYVVERVCLIDDDASSNPVEGP